MWAGGLPHRRLHLCKRGKWEVCTQINHNLTTYRSATDDSKAEISSSLDNRLWCLQPNCSLLQFLSPCRRSSLPVSFICCFHALMVLLAVCFCLLSMNRVLVVMFAVLGRMLVSRFYNFLPLLYLVFALKCNSWVCGNRSSIITLSSQFNNHVVKKGRGGIACQKACRFFCCYFFGIWGLLQRITFVSLFVSVSV